MKTLGYFTFFVFLFFCVVIIWGMNKGFDLSDEGYYLLGFQRNQEIFSTLTYFQLLLRKLFFFIELDIISIRIIRFVFYIFSSLFFSWSLWKWLKINQKNSSNSPPFLLFFSFITIGTFIGYAFGPQSLSYNSLSSVLLLLAIGCFLLNLYYSDKQKYFLSYMLILIAGSFTGLEIFVRVSAGVVLFFSFLLLLLIHGKKSYNLIFFFCGFLLAFIIFFSFIQSFHLFYESVYNIFATKAHGESHSVSYITRDVLISIAYFIIFIFYSFLLALIFVLAKNKIKILSEPKLFLLVFTIYFILSFFLAEIIFMQDFLEYKRSGYFLFMMISLISFALTEFLFSKKENILKKIWHGRELYSILTFLFLCPFILSFGTNNRMLLISLYGVCFWFGTTLVIYFLNYLRREQFVIFVSSSCLCGCFLFIYFFVFHPYRIENLFYQTESISFLNKNSSMKLDEQTKKYVEQVSTILSENGFQKGDPVIGIYRLPGLIYLLDGYSPGNFLLGNEADFLFCEDLKKSKMKLQRSFILIRDEYSSDFLVNLKTVGIDFSNYKKVGEAEWNLWENPVTNIYAPIQINTDLIP